MANKKCRINSDCGDDTFVCVDYSCACAYGYFLFENFDNKLEL